MKKRVISLCMSLCLLLGLLPVTAQAAEQTQTEPLKILAIGSSFSLDGIAYLEDVARAEGQSFVLGCLMKGESTLAQHASYTVPDENGQLPEVYNYYYRDLNDRWRMRRNENNKIVKADMLYGIQAQDWDYILLQQNGTGSGRPETYDDNNPDLSTLVSFVKANAPDAKLIWQMPWPYRSDSISDEYKADQSYMHSRIAEGVQANIVPKVGTTFEFVVPSGTAIQNARTGAGDNLNRDTMHLSTLGRVIVSYTWYAKLMGLDKLNAINYVDVVKSFDHNASKNQGTAAKVLTAAEQEIALNAINSDLSNPFEITRQTPAAPDYACGPETACHTFADVDAGQWYHKAADFVLQKGIMCGYSDTMFAPEDTMTRAMAVQILYNKAGQPEVTVESTFADVTADQWYTNAVLWATQNNIVGGYSDGTFGANDSVTVEQLATLLWKDSGVTEQDAAGWCEAKGIFANITCGALTDTVTRIQAAQMLANYLSK